MSLHIYIAHSGEHLLADPVSFASYVHIRSVHRITFISPPPSSLSTIPLCSVSVSSLLDSSRLTLCFLPSNRPDALRSWITRNTSIPSQRQILMTARGKNVKIQTLATEVCFFRFITSLSSLFTQVHILIFTPGRTRSSYTIEAFSPNPPKSSSLNCPRRNRPRSKAPRIPWQIRTTCRHGGICTPPDGPGR